MESDGYESNSDGGGEDAGYFTGQHVPQDLEEKEEPPRHELRILALNPDGALSIDQTMDLAQKKGVHMLSLSENGATAWKAAKMAREVKRK